MYSHQIISISLITYVQLHDYTLLNLLGKHFSKHIIRSVNIHYCQRLSPLLLLYNKVSMRHLFSCSFVSFMSLLREQHTRIFAQSSFANRKKPSIFSHEKTTMFCWKPRAGMTFWNFFFLLPGRQSHTCWTFSASAI